MKTKKILSFLLSFSIVFSVFAAPVNAYAEGPVTEGPVIEEPVIEEPVVEEPAEEPIEEEPAEEPTEEEPSEEPTEEEPAEEEPTEEEPVEEPTEEPAIEEQAILEEPETHSHVWSDTWNKSKTHHWHVCTADGCDITVTSHMDSYAEHDYSVNDTCTCGAVKEFVHEHVWAEAWTNSNGLHWHECIGEGECDVEKYDILKDGYALCEFDSVTNTCICGATSPAHEHVWSAKPNERTKVYHWHSCDVAGCNLDGTSGKDQPLHYGYEPHTFDKNGYCEKCNWQIKDTHHTHVWDETTYVTNGGAHWYKCTAANCWISNVEFNKGYEKHKFDIATQKCKVCDYQSEHTHEWLDTWDKTSTHHFRVCAGKESGECYLGNKHELKPGYEEHIYNASGACIVCNYKYKGSHVHNWSIQWTYTDEIHYHDCTAADCFISLVEYNDSYGAHQLNATGKCDCGYQAPHVHDWATYAYDTLYHWQICEGPYDVCDVTVNTAMPDYEYHSYDATTNMCECGKEKPDGVVADITPEVTEDDKNVGDAIIDGDVDSYKDIILTEEETDFHKDFGLDVDIWLTVKDATEEIPEEEAQLITDKLSGCEVGTYLDIQLWKQVETQDRVKLTYLGDKITVTLKLPEELKNTISNRVRRYGVIRLHGDVAEMIDCRYDANTGLLSFETDRFSYYAIVYKDAWLTNESEETTAVQLGTLDKSPNTGDINVIPYFVGMALASGAILIFVDRMDKKRKFNNQ